MPVGLQLNIGMKYRGESQQNSSSPTIRRPPPPIGMMLMHGHEGHHGDSITRTRRVGRNRSRSISIIRALLLVIVVALFAFYVFLVSKISIPKESGVITASSNRDVILVGRKGTTDNTLIKADNLTQADDYGASRDDLKEELPILLLRLPDETNITKQELLLVQDDHDLNKITTEEAAGGKSTSDHLLSVPFFVYDEFLHNEELLNFTEMYHADAYDRMHKDGKYNTKVLDETNVTFEEYLNEFRYYKHAGDIHFVRSALEHPMRVFDPKQAKLFVVPALLTMDLVDRIYRYKETEKKTSQHMKRIERFLRDSPWFKRNNGNDHIVPIAYFRAQWISRYAPRLLRCNVVQMFEVDNDPNFVHADYIHERAMYKIFYVGSPCDMIAHDEKTQDFVFIGSLFNKHGQGNRFFRNRRDICNWLPNSTTYTHAVCGHGDKCMNLPRALVGFHARGDTISANRLFDTILSGTVPIFTLKPQYRSQPEWYDWSKLSYFADVENKTQFLSDIDEIMSNRTDIMVKTRNLLENKDLFDWQTNVPFDVYMVSECILLFANMHSLYHIFSFPLLSY